MPLKCRIVHVANLIPSSQAQVIFAVRVRRYVCAEQDEEPAVLTIQLCARVRGGIGPIALDRLVALPLAADKADPEAGLGQRQVARTAAPAA